MSRRITCPTCRETGPWPDMTYAPFCSERCKMVDLGRWLGEEYRITSPLTAEDLQELTEDDMDKLGREIEEDGR